MAEIEDGESVEVKGSSATYTLKNDGGVYSCSCPAWRHQSLGIEQRTCKHLKAYRSANAEAERVGKDNAARFSAAPKKKKASSSSDEEKAGTEPAILLAHKWDNETDVTGWWMSEKLDGVRAFWDGEKFISRQGNTFIAPDWFVDGLPTDHALDGELWMDRGAFQKTVSIVRRQDKSKHWEQIRYLIFDAPRVDGPFEKRVEWINDLVDDVSPDFASPVAHEKCRGFDHLKIELDRIEKL